MSAVQQIEVLRNALKHVITESSAEVMEQMGTYISNLNASAGEFSGEQDRAFESLGTRL